MRKPMRKVVLALAMVASLAVPAAPAHAGTPLVVEVSAVHGHGLYDFVDYPGCNVVGLLGLATRGMLGGGFCGTWAYDGVARFPDGTVGRFKASIECYEASGCELFYRLEDAKRNSVTGVSQNPTFTPFVGKFRFAGGIIRGTRGWRNATGSVSLSADAFGNTRRQPAYFSGPLTVAID
jgi:hypothetical protein